MWARPPPCTEGQGCGHSGLGTDMGDRLPLPTPGPQTHGLPQGPDRRDRADRPGPPTLRPQDPAPLLSTRRPQAVPGQWAQALGGPGALNPTLPLWAQHWTEARATRTLLINSTHMCTQAGAHGWGPPPPEAGPGQQTTGCPLTTSPAPTLHGPPQACDPCTVQGTVHPRTWTAPPPPAEGPGTGAAGPPGAGAARAADSLACLSARAMRLLEMSRRR